MGAFKPTIIDLFEYTHYLNIVLTINSPQFQFVTNNKPTFILDKPNFFYSVRVWLNLILHGIVSIPRLLNCFNHFFVIIYFFGS